jgi:methylmalonyl-CoA/ethylmalonyl-CoA epimerase
MVSSATTDLFTGVAHVCVVTADVDRSVRVFADRYGIGPWRVYVYDRSNMTVDVDGEASDFSMRVALGSVGNCGIELIQPTGGRNPYADSLARHNGADHVHHLKLDVSDFSAAAGHLEGLGMARTLDGLFTGADATAQAHGVYFPTENDLGFTLEIGEMHAAFEPAPPEYTYP